MMSWSTKRYQTNGFIDRPPTVFPGSITFCTFGILLSISSAFHEALMLRRSELTSLVPVSAFTAMVSSPSRDCLLRGWFQVRAERKRQSRNGEAGLAVSQR